MALSLLATGLGATQPEADPGTPFPSNPPAAVTSTVEVRVNGKPAEVLGAVGRPGAAGQYQVDFRVPADTAKGPVVVQLGVEMAVDNSVKINDSVIQCVVALSNLSSNISTIFLARFAALMRFSRMRRVRSSWRFNWTSVYSSVIIVLACPAIFEASIAVAPHQQGLCIRAEGWAAAMVHGTLDGQRMGDPGFYDVRSQLRLRRFVG